MDPLTNLRIQGMQASGEIPPPAVTPSVPVSQLDAMLDWAQRSGVPEEYAMQVLRSRGVTPEVIQQRMQWRTLQDNWRRQEPERRRRLFEADAKTANMAAESFQDPRGAVQRGGVTLPGDPYSPQRAAQDRAIDPNRPQWDTQEDADGRLWYIDKTGRYPARPATIPSQNGPTQLIKRKDIGTPELQSLRENADQLTQAMRAFGLNLGQEVEGTKGDAAATGWKGFLWDPLLQRIDEAGVPTRAAIGNIGSLKIKQRSGGAVPAAEMERLKPFVPKETDSDAVVAEKLSGFIQEYTKMLDSDIRFYEESNRRVPAALKNRVQQMSELGRAVRARQITADEAMRRASIPAQGSIAPAQERPSLDAIFRR